MGSFIISQYVLDHFNFWVAVILMMIGLYAMITKNNLIKKLIGMSIFQTAIILFYVSAGVKEGATIPILEHHAAETEQVAAGDAGAEHGSVVGADHDVSKSSEKAPAHEVHEINPDDYSNPLPHVLMLTAIVVGVATLGVALAVAQVIYKNYGTLEEDEILAKIKAAENDG
ncbi:MAG: cation:proton antiporter subunit C [Verrucomicrobiales bacterium]|nr:cation:proton antiporter subunit C [Verrucomicrobiales bacterium]